VVVEKNVRITERFFDNRYKPGAALLAEAECKRRTVLLDKVPLDFLN
jgi:hypothetical protein